MVVEVRIYRRFDADLLAMYNSGYDLARMFETAILAYAHGQPLCYTLLPDRIPVAFPENKTLHFRVLVTDKESIRMLKSVRFGFRNAFCKMLLRGFFATIPLSQYFADAEYVGLEKERITKCPILDGAAACPVKEPRQFGFRKKPIQPPAAEKEKLDESTKEDDLVNALESIMEDGALPYT